jgi:hypothetical protein
MLPTQHRCPIVVGSVCIASSGIHMWQLFAPGFVRWEILTTLNKALAGQD